MEILLKIIISVTGIISIYLLLENRHINKKTKEKLKNITNDIYIKIENTGYFKKLTYRIGYLKNGSYIKNSAIAVVLDIILNKYFYTVFSVLVSFAIFAISINYIKVMSSSIILSASGYYILNEVLNLAIYLKKKNILDSFFTYVINLKNYTLVDNNGISAVLNTEADNNLKVYIEEFKESILRGVSTKRSFENLKESIDIKEISMFFTYIEMCNLNGGDTNYVIDSYIDVYNNKLLQKEKEKEEINSTKYILLILFLIHIYVVISYIFSNNDYTLLIRESFIGKIILNLGIVIYFPVIKTIINLNKMEE